MTLLEKLTSIRTRLTSVLSDINTALVANGATEATSLAEVSTAIDSIEVEKTSPPWMDSRMIYSWGSFFEATNPQCDYAALEHIDTSNGTNFMHMFAGRTDLTSIPSLNTGKGTNFSYMFSGCTNLTSIPSLNTNNGRDFSYMFNRCTKLTSISLSYTSNGTNFSRMFNDCSSLTSISPLNTSNGTNFSYMFSGCSSLTSIVVTTTAEGRNFSTNSFSGCTSLESINIGAGFKSHIYLQYSPNLTQECLHTMIEKLADMSAATTAPIFQVGNTNLAKIDEEHIAMLYSKGWEYS